MCRELFIAGTDDPGWWTVCGQATNGGRLLAATVVFVPAIASQRKVRLPACHRQVDVGENLGIEQGAVQFATGVVYSVALAQRIQAVALAGVSLTSHQQRIEHGTMVG